MVPDGTSLGASSSNLTGFEVPSILSAIRANAGSIHRSYTKRLSAFSPFREMHDYALSSAEFLFLLIVGRSDGLDFEPLEQHVHLGLSWRFAAIVSMTNIEEALCNQSVMWRQESV